MSILMEGGDTRKRKIAFIDEEDEDEDIKIEKFFALIRSAKDIRDQLLDVDNGSKTRATKNAVTATATVTAKAKTVEKKAEVTQRVHKKPPPSSAFAKEKIPITGAGVSITVAARNDSGSSSTRNCTTEEQNNCNSKGGVDYKNNNDNNNNSYQQGRNFLDLNLNLSL